MKRYYVFFVLLGLVSLGAIAAQTTASRPAKADRELAMRLQNTNEQIDLYASREEKLPQSLTVVEGDHTGITYKQIGNATYELCATFQTSTQRNVSDLSSPSSYIDAYNHPKGHQCYKLIANVGQPNPKPLPLRN